MRKMIISERPNNPAYFDKMSDLLNHLLQEQKDGKIQYKELIKKLIMIILEKMKFWLSEFTKQSKQMHVTVSEIWIVVV